MTDDKRLNTETISALKETLGEIFDELRDAFIEDGEVLLQQAQEAAVEGDYASLASQVHTLKSSAKNIGADELGESCVQVESLLDAQDYSTIQMLLPAMNEQMQGVKQALRAM